MESESDDGKSRPRLFLFPRCKLQDLPIGAGGYRGSVHREQVPKSGVPWLSAEIIRLG